MSGAAGFGIVGGFDSAAAATAAAQAVASAGFTRWDVYGPAPLAQLEQLAPGGQARRLTAVMAVAALLGAGFGYLLQYWSAVYDYPLNVGGRPNAGWPGFIPSSWEICVLFAVWSGLIAFLLSRRLPQLYHPLFAAPGFERASQDRFFICVECADPAYDSARLRQLLQHHGAEEITEVGE